MIELPAARGSRGSSTASARSSICRILTPSSRRSGPRPTSEGTNMWATAIWIRTNVSARTPARGRSTILQASVPGENSTTCSGPSPQRSRRVCPFSAETKGIRCRRKRPVSSDSGANFRSIVAWAPSVQRPSDSGLLKPVSFNIRLAAGSEKYTV